MVIDELFLLYPNRGKVLREILGQYSRLQMSKDVIFYCIVASGITAKQKTNHEKMKRDTKT